MPDDLIIPRPTDLPELPYPATLTKEEAREVIHSLNEARIKAQRAYDEALRPVRDRHYQEREELRLQQEAELMPLNAWLHEKETEAKKAARPYEVVYAGVDVGTRVLGWVYRYKNNREAWRGSKELVEVEAEVVSVYGGYPRMLLVKKDGTVGSKRVSFERGPDGKGPWRIKPDEEEGEV